MSPPNEYLLRSTKATQGTVVPLCPILNPRALAPLTHQPQALCSVHTEASQLWHVVSYCRPPWNQVAACSIGQGPLAIKRKSKSRGGRHEAPDWEFPITVGIPTSPSTSADTAAAVAATAAAAAAAAVAAAAVA